jgi:hypothetical protein
MVSSYWGRRDAALRDTNACFAADIQSLRRSFHGFIRRQAIIK